MMSVAGLADLGLYQHHTRLPVAESDTDMAAARLEAPIEFFDDPGHSAECRLR